MSTASFAQVGSVLRQRQELSWKQGALVTIPIDAKYRIDKQPFLAAVNDLVIRAAEEGVHGPQVTNWMVRRLFRAMGPNAQEANAELLYNNAVAAAQIGLELMLRIIVLRD